MLSTQTLPILFSSVELEKGKLIYRAVWHWSTRMHDWLGLMEFSALDLHFSLSARSGAAHKHNLAAARLRGSYVSAVIASCNCYQVMFASLPTEALLPHAMLCMRGYGSPDCSQQIWHLQSGHSFHFFFFLLFCGNKRPWVWLVLLFLPSNPFFLCNCSLTVVLLFHKMFPLSKINEWF